VAERCAPPASRIDTSAHGPNSRPTGESCKFTLTQEGAGLRTASPEGPRSLFIPLICGVAFVAAQRPLGIRKVDAFR
jgi:hypothetical protein